MSKTYIVLPLNYYHVLCLSHPYHAFLCFAHLPDRRSTRLLHLRDSHRGKFIMTQMRIRDVTRDRIGSRKMSS